MLLTRRKSREQLKRLITPEKARLLTQITGEEKGEKLTDGESIEDKTDEKDDFPKELTFNNLIEKVTSDSSTEAMIFQFLLVYRTICSPQELLTTIIQKCENQPFEQFKRCTFFVRFWVDNYWIDFESNKHILLPMLTQWSEQVTDPSSNLFLQGILKRIQFHSTKINPTQNDILPLVPADSVQDVFELTFWESNPEDIAQQLTLIEEGLFRAIKPWEFLGQGWAKSAKEQNSPNVLKFIAWFNEVSIWVQTEIITEVRLKDRVRKFSRFLDICEHLVELQNYNGLLEIFSAFQSSSVHRLKKTLTSINKRSLSFYNKYLNLVNGTDHFQYLRLKIQNTTRPCVPYIGMYLTDFTFIDEGNKDTTSTGLINYRKRQMIASSIREIIELQKLSYNFTPTPEIQDYIIQFKRCRSPDSLYAFSKFIEPKEGEAFNPNLPIEDLEDGFVEKYVGDNQLKKFILKMTKTEDAGKKKNWRTTIANSSKKARCKNTVKISPFRIPKNSQESELDLSIDSYFGEFLDKISADYVQQNTAMIHMAQMTKQKVDEFRENVVEQLQNDRQKTIQEINRVKDRLKLAEEDQQNQLGLYEIEVAKLRAQLKLISVSGVSSHPPPPPPPSEKQSLSKQATMPAAYRRGESISPEGSPQNLRSKTTGGHGDVEHSKYYSDFDVDSDLELKISPAQEKIRLSSKSEQSEDSLSSL